MTAGSRNGSTGTNGSSSAVMISAGTRMRSIDAHGAGAVVVVRRHRGTRSAAPCRPRRTGARSRCVAAAPVETPGKRRAFRRMRRLQVRGRNSTGRAKFARRSSARTHCAELDRRRHGADGRAAPAAPRRRTRRPASAPGCRRASSRRRRSPAGRRARSARASRSRRPRSGPSDRGRATAARCRRSCAD